MSTLLATAVDWLQQSKWSFFPEKMDQALTEYEALQRPDSFAQQTSVAAYEMNNVYNCDLSGLTGLRQCNTYKQYKKTLFSEPTPLCIKETMKQDVDLRCIGGVGASKADLESYADMTEMCHKRSLCVTLVAENTLEKNLAWHEIRLLNSESHDDKIRFVPFAGKHGRYFYLNCGGSHHLCAARWQAVEQDKTVIIADEVERVSINEDLICSLARTHYGVVLYMHSSDSMYYQFWEELQRQHVNYYEMDIGSHGKPATLFVFEKSDKSKLVFDLCLEHRGIDFFERMNDLVCEQNRK